MTVTVTTSQTAHLFHLAPLIQYGEGSAALAGPELRRLGARRVLVLTDAGILSAGVCAPVLESVRAHGLELEIFCDMATNPKDVDVAAAVDAFRGCGADGVVAVGGGSALDVAKCVAVIATNGGHVHDYEDGARPVVEQPAPLILVPTTAGTGSETVGGAFIVDRERLVKMHIVAAPAQVALCDPLLTLTLPPEMTAATGLDALTHAVGAYVSVERQPLADAMALYAIEDITTWLPRAVRQPHDREARSHMMVGSLAAGISTKGGGTGEHAFSHGVNALFDVHHGVGCALFLADVMEHNLQPCLGRYARVARALGVNAPGMSTEDCAVEGVAVVRRLVAELGVAPLREFGVTAADLPRLADKVMEDAFSLSLNPVPITEFDVERILESVHRAPAR